MPTVSRPEKPQKGNKYGLTVRQHVLSRANIARFADAKGRVAVCDISRKRVRFASPNDAIFCAMRAWSQREEKGFMAAIESQFQMFASAIISGAVSSIAEEENRIIREFFALWYMRARYRTLPQQEIRANGVTGWEVTKDQEEHLESCGVMFARKGGNFLARQLNGFEIQVRANEYSCNELSSIKWGVIHAQEGEFLVPDVPNHTIIPLTPMICLAGNTRHGTILKSNVAAINRALQSVSREYFFARDFSKCPI